MGLTLHKNQDFFEIGRFEDICSHCAQAYPASERMNQVGKLTGKRIYKNHTPSGAAFCLCEECLKKIARDI